MRLLLIEDDEFRVLVVGSAVRAVGESETVRDLDIVFDKDENRLSEETGALAQLQAAINSAPPIEGESVRRLHVMIRKFEPDKAPMAVDVSTEFKQQLNLGLKEAND